MKEKAFRLLVTAWVLSSAALAHTTGEPESGGRTPIPCSKELTEKVASIIQARCVTCHREDGQGGTDYTTFASVRANLPLMLRRIKAGTMPDAASIDPTTECGGPNMFKSPRYLHKGEIAILQDWKACKENPLWEQDALLTPSPEPKKVDGFAGGKPTVVVNTVDEKNGDDFKNGFPIPALKKGVAAGKDSFRNFILKGDFAGKNLTGFEILPQNEKPADGTPFPIDHHAHLFLADCKCAQDLEKKFQDKLAKAKADGVDLKPDDDGEYFPGPGWNDRSPSCGDKAFSLIGSWFPGAPPNLFPKGVAQKIPEGICLIAQMHFTHYNETKPIFDKTRIGLHFEEDPKKVERQRVLGEAVNEKFLIKANDDDHKEYTTYTVPEDSTLFTVVPHCHQLCKGQRVDATPPGGGDQKTQCITNIKWNFEHQGAHDFTKPICLKKGTVLKQTCSYDNRPKYRPITDADIERNPSIKANDRSLIQNPRQFNDPPKDIPWGPVADLEMCRIDYALTSGFKKDECQTLEEVSSNSKGR